jgi:hypothetical protein
VDKKNDEMEPYPVPCIPSDATEFLTLNKCPYATEALVERRISHRFLCESS